MTSSTTAEASCVEIELIETLVTANLIQITPNVAGKKDLIKTGIDFEELQPEFVVKLPNGGSVIRDVKLPSTNVVKIEVTFVPVSGGSSKVIRGSPTSLPNNDIPSEEVESIIIKVVKTSNGEGPRRVRLSVIVCSETSTTTTHVPSE